MKIFQLIDLIIRLFRLNKKSKVVLLFLIPAFLVGQNNAGFWLGKRPSAAPTNLLLDDYPGAAAAYSLRKLDKDYGGFAVEVRRSSDGATQNIGFSNNDFDTASLNSFCSGTTCTVRTWYDQSGNSRNAVQATAINQPTIYTGGSIIFENSKSALNFDGIRQFLQISTSFGNIADNISVFVTTKLNFSGSNPTIISKSYNNNGSYTLASYTNQGKIFIWADGVQYVNLAASDTRGSQMLISNINLTGSNGLKIYKNSLLYTQFTATTDLIGTNTFFYEIGRNNQDQNYWWNGTIQEIILYPINQTASRINIETNINTYYSIY